KILRQVVRRLRVEIRQAVKAFRPRALQVITQPQIQSESPRGPPGVVKIQGAINLLACREGRYDSLGKKMVFKIVEIVRIPEQEIGKPKSRAGDSGKGSKARLAGDAEIKCPARNVGLRIIIPANLNLH